MTRFDFICPTALLELFSSPDLHLVANAMEDPRKRATSDPVAASRGRHSIAQYNCSVVAQCAIDGRRVHWRTRLE